MRFFLFLLFCFFALSAAALLLVLSLRGGAESGDGAEVPELRYGLVWDENELSIRFPEPVVPLSVVENTMRKHGSDAERGLDLFSVSGSPAPTLRWVDQNVLRVDFAPGCSPADSFRVDFRPGVTYLGGKPVEPASYSFSPRPVRLSVRFLSHYAGGAALVSAAGAETREALALGQQHGGLRVRFRRMFRLPFAGWVGMSAVPATLRPAPFAVGTAGDEAVANALLEQGNPADLRSASLLPQTLLALPSRPLVPGAHYRVEIEAEPESGFASSQSDPVTIPRELGVTLEASLEEGSGVSPSRPRVCLRFDAPVEEVALQSLWRGMELRLGGQRAVLSSDGQCYSARVGGHEVRLRLLRQLPLAQGCKVQSQKSFYRVSQPGCAVGLEMELEAGAPLEVEMTLPRDFRAAHGLTPLKRRFSLRVLPAWPLWQGTGNRVPLSGSHLLRLPALNMGAVTATLHHWDAESAARLYPFIRRARRDDSSLLELTYRLGWLRQHTDLWLLNHLPHAKMIRYTEEALKLVQQDRLAQRELRRRVFAEVRAFSPVSLKLEGGSDAFAARRDILLDMDAAVGGAEKLRPGLYLVRLSSQPSSAVLSELASLPLKAVAADEGGTDDPLSCQVEYLVQVTDVALHHGGGYLFANSLANGEPLEAVQVTAYEMPLGDGEAPQEARATGCRMSLPQGAGRLVPEAAEKLLLVQRGEDYCLDFVPEEYHWSADEEGVAESLRMELFCDRPLYRPGEQVHLRGVLRDMSGGTPALPEPGEIRLIVHRPNGELLEERTLLPDAYGAVTADFRLPEGEEDVTGIYHCELHAGGESADEFISCEVFRRNAFELEVKALAEAVAPKELRVQVSARHYDGTPLRGGKVQLHIRASDKILRPEPGEKYIVGVGGTLPDGSVEAYTEREMDANDATDVGPGLAPALLRFAEREVELELDAEGRGEYRMGLAHLNIRKNCQQGWIGVSATAANEHEELVRAWDSCAYHPADFRIVWDDDARRVRLLDAGSGEPLAREQRLELTVRSWESRWAPLAPGVELQVEPNTHVLGEKDNDDVLLRQEILVPAGSSRGVDISALLAPLEGRDMSMALELEGYDAESRLMMIRRSLRLSSAPSLPVRFTLKVQGNELCVTPAEDWGCARLHAFIGAQGRLRHVLAAVGEGGELRLPLQENEYGEIELTLLRCQPGENGGKACWSKGQESCERPRPDKLLTVALELPKGVRPGEACAISGRVTDAAGRPQRAGLTLFAVDAGMLSVSPYSLPRLEERFYRGSTPFFSLGSQYHDARTRPAARPMGLAEWGLPSAEERHLWLNWSHSYYFWGVGESAQETAQDFYDRVAWRAGDIPTTFLSYVPGEGLGEGGSGLGAAGGAAPRLRRNFAPLALWQGCVETAEDGSFHCPLTLPDTLTTYRVFALALGADGSSFGQAEGDFLVNQPLMLAAGTPFFMSMGDQLQVPLTITNNSGKAGSWNITLKEEGTTQQVELAAHESRTLLFDVTAQQEGEHVLTWMATGEAGGDALEARFPVLFPAPLLKEHHRFVLEAGESLDSASLLAAELAGSTRGSITLEYAASPLLHFRGSLDYLLTYPYGCTEQTASALLPWLYYDKLAPYCPQMAQTSKSKVPSIIASTINTLLSRQQEDGGLAYWGRTKGERHPSNPWASAYAALVLTLAEEMGHKVPAEAMKRLRDYLGKQEWKDESPLARYAAARARGEAEASAAAMAEALRAEASAPRRERHSLAALRFMAELKSAPTARHEALLRWLRSQGRDYRHPSTWSSGWQLIALGEYLRLEASAVQPATLMVNGEALPAGVAPACREWSASPALAAAAPRLSVQQGRVYVTLKAKAQPELAAYPGVTEKGLQVTRVYETQGADGIWRENLRWKVGDIVRVTLTCAKAAEELEYLVLEDKLPANLEIINPHVPAQALGIEGGGEGICSPCIDHKEYLADRVRAFCTRWQGRELLNMRYYARVMRAGEATAPPAAAQLMYEPQCYGLSPNARVHSHR